MLYGQKVHPLNFDYGNTVSVTTDGIHILVLGSSFSAQVRCEEITAFCTKLSFDNSNVTDKRHYSDGILTPYRQGQPVLPRQTGNISFTGAASTIEIGASHLKIRMATGFLLETADPGFGFNGEKFILTFKVNNATGFYGFGERTKRLNKSGDSMDFWNIDVVAVFPHTYDRDDYDPAYVTIPLAIIKTGDLYSGIYFDNPERVIIDIEKTRSEQLMYQSLGGNPSIYFINGPSLREVVRHFTQLTGRAAVPPLWSLGYHQCRWGYQTEADFLALEDDFKKFDIPVSAFWHDIDYMDEYRLFTWDKEDFPAPATLGARLKKKGIRSVAIVDPGVKREEGYKIYDSGKENGVFCKTVSGRDYVGHVWPGDTVFPDFTLQSVQTWWADRLAAFIKESAIDGVWLDMNDPATGFSAAEDMLFANGTVAHAKYHNQYGHFMAKASLKAFAQLDANSRPFLLTRSGFTGTQRYSAIWTGDNASNWPHLRMSIPCTINLGLSGVAFNGPDVGGFMGHTTPELLIRWYQAGFLFPFFRNHSMLNSKNQEPWQFGAECLAYVRETIKTRYRLLPYLYNCFFAHYLTGDPVLRPLLYEYAGQEFDNLDDQFLVGDSIMVAPILYGEDGGQEVVIRGKKCQLRHVTLPPGWWFDLNRGEWTEGGRILLYAARLDEVPLFIRDGAIIPYYPGPLRNSTLSLKKLELHIFVKERPGRLAYFIDDQETQSYQNGHYNTACIDAEADGHQVRVTLTESGNGEMGTVNFRPVLYGRHQGRKMATTINGKPKSKALKSSTRQWVCKSIAVLA